MSNEKQDVSAQEQGASDSQSSPTRYNASTVMYLLAALVLIIMAYTVFFSGGDAPETEEQASEQEEGGAYQADAPGTNPEDAQTFDETRPQPSDDVANALDRYQDETGGRLDDGQRLSSSDGPAAGSSSPADSRRNPYGRPGRTRRPSQDEQERMREQQQARRSREQALQEAIASDTRYEARAPRFSPEGPAPRSAQSGSAQSGPDQPRDRGPYGRRSAGPPASTPDRTVRGRDITVGSRGSNSSGSISGSPYGPTGAAGGSPIRSNGAEPSDNERFLANVRAEAFSGNRMTRVQGPLPAYTLAKGTIIPIAMESAASSDLPGSIIARTTADVYDRTKQHILIPAGSEIVTDYGQPSAVGQSRLLIAATRMTLPDGRFVNFQEVQATDPSGIAGLKDVKDRHLLARFGAVGALAVLGTAVNVATFNDAGFYGGISSGRRDTTESGEVVIYPPAPGGYGQPSFRGAVGQSFAGQINKVLGELLERSIDREPTLKLRSGLRGRLLLGQDIDMSRPYYDEGSDLERIDRAARRKAARDRQRAPGAAAIPARQP